MVEQQYQQEAQKYLAPELEGKEILHLSYGKLTEGQDDLRDLIPELADFEKPIHPADVVIDSDMSLHKAFQGLSPDCPHEILVKQQLIRLFYFGTDGELHHGQAVVHEKLAGDVLAAFQVLLKERIPVGSVIPMAHPDFHNEGKWDDHASMEANNSSGFNYRAIITADGEKKRLSLHSLGLAFDVNPVNNPCYGSPEVHSLDGYEKEAAAGYESFVPSNGRYDMADASSFHERHPLVLELESRGWTWGGRWADPKDLHHFQKVPAEIAERVSQLREA